MVHPKGSELDAALSIICKNISFVKTTTVVHCDKLSFRLRGVIITKTSQQQLHHVAKHDMYKFVFRLHGKHVLKSGVWSRRHTQF